MTKSLGSIVVAGLLLIFASGSSSLAVEGRNPLPVAPKPTRMAPVPLSNAECTGLGGKVVDVVHGCGSGKICYTTDKNGVIHHACITKQ
jgi:hypothetical protein